MPRKRLPPRLQIRTERGRRVWIIRDGPRYVRTGCGEENRDGAEAALADHIASKWTAPASPRSAGQLKVVEALAIYGTHHAPTVADPARIGYAIDALTTFWADQPVAAVKGETCRRYARARNVGAGTVRRELGVLNAALRYCYKEGILADTPRPVTLPKKPPPRDRWLTREEAARLLRAARPWPHLARFILIGVYTATRGGRIKRLQWIPNLVGGHVDLENGVLHRKSITEGETKKRASAAKVPRKLLNHLRRWRRLGDTRQWVIEHQGKPIATRFRRSWAGAVTAANLDGLTPHDLRHTAITWMMQGGAEPTDVCSLAGISLEELQATYWHHHPKFQKSATEALGG